MLCKREGCSNPVMGKALYCSGACRVKQSRSVTPTVTDVSCPVTVGGANVTVQTPSVTDMAENGPQVLHKSVENRSNAPEIREITIMGKCYNRAAIPCSEFVTRPMPLDVTDTPKPGSRGKYVRVDGSDYQFDFCGVAFECPHEVFDDKGNRRTEVYTMSELKEAQGVA